MPEYLYDQPRDYFKHGCCTDGKFDPEKAKALGYSPAQYGEIQEFIGDESSKDTAPLVEPEEETGG